MRIVAGTARGRPLKGPRGATLRPTADRVRESIFNILGQWLDGMAVLDLYAGTGALSLEALSRGAARAVMVDSSREAAALCRQNAATLQMTERVEVVAVAIDARSLERIARQGPFDLILADPPYAGPEPGSVLALVGAAGLVRPGGRLVVEHDRRQDAPSSCPPLLREDQRRFGDTLVSFYRSVP